NHEDVIRHPLLRLTNPKCNAPVEVVNEALGRAPSPRGSSPGYAGVLVGPAAIGLVAKSAGLPVAFWLLAALVSAVVFTARTVTGFANLKGVG
ncbi:MAG TPA: hypothetical protein VNY10_16270, partial [Roseiarcus sp.]|nr:hypothetical protein [Roseiarcus sp.]